LSAAGEDTLAGSRELAAKLRSGQPADSDQVEKNHKLMRRMIDEVGRSLAAKANADWQGDEFGDSAAKRAADFMDAKAQQLLQRTKEGASRVGDFFKRWSEKK
jgi:monomeric isocitrate dehydrogenase